MRSSAPPRSYLFAPADNERLLAKVFHAGADAVVLDLEDAVLPQRKVGARAVLARVLGTATSLRVSIQVRINPISDRGWRDDVASAATPVTAAIRLAKAESANDVRELDIELQTAETRLGISIGTIDIVPTIETAVGLLHSSEMARCPRVVGFCFGAADFLADINAEMDDSASALQYAYSKLVLVSRSCDLLPPIAPVYTTLADQEGLRRTTEQFRRYGFFGRSCIHPSQVSIINEAFSPSPQQVRDAAAVLTVYESAVALGRGVAVMKNGQFLDESVVKRSRRVMQLASQLAEKKDTNEAV